MDMNTLPANRETLITRRQLASVLPVSYDTLARWASKGEGPPFLKIGPRTVAYRVGDIREWLERHKKGGQE